MSVLAIISIGFCLWIFWKSLLKDATINFSNVHSRIDGLNNKIERLEAQCSDYESEIESLRRKLNNLEDTVDFLEKPYRKDIMDDY
ncbi:MAG: hypothetical protein VX136_00405 [Pseudomonadota bacterium]|nr:hypothetical protein [Acinetobacter ursingii]MEC8055583.1 hypothetical protein [Pseudomonadota bacterium]